MSGSSRDEVSTTTGSGRVRSSALRRRSTSSPSTFGSFKSRRITFGVTPKARRGCGCSPKKKSRASSPSRATNTWLARLRALRARSVSSASFGLSSTNRISTCWVTCMWSPVLGEREVARRPLVELDAVLPDIIHSPVPRAPGSTVRNPLKCGLRTAADRVFLRHGGAVLRQFSGVGRHHPHPQGVAHEACQIADAEPPHDLGPMRLHGLHAEVQAAGDLQRGVALSQEPEHFDLTGTELAERPPHRQGGFDRRAEAAQLPFEDAVL